MDCNIPNWRQVWQPIIDIHWRRGLARVLVADIESWLIQQGAKKIGVLVENDRPGSMAF
jgi:hypothetical protein